ncbi:hypothetical protein M0813_10886 [Anaeramoeba flamelloides]|uniref:Uncharacterized protein n=1 Tax=Anaeramoeba flamelloides TaxID=1746091 RepID=A0AAV7YKH7_9EUKA|nr:hypothetical protein M0812_24542 [Anaeramoeba flamelloides]KAJ6226457.1 hypothetical protein M0813_10886 [Anaeramoeba flamelloides]
MGNKKTKKGKGYSLELPDTPTIRRKGSKSWTLRCKKDPFLIIPRQVVLTLRPQNFSFYTVKGTLVKTYSYYNLEAWGSKENNLFLKISKKMIVLKFTNPEIIDNEIDIYVNQIYVDLDRVKQEKKEMEQVKDEFGIPIDEETGMPLRLKNEAMQIMLEKDKETNKKEKEQEQTHNKKEKEK